jgi:hypothetical protein
MMVLLDQQMVLSPDLASAVLLLEHHALGEAPPALPLSSISSEDTLVDQTQADAAQILAAA